MTRIPHSLDVLTGALLGGGGSFTLAAAGAPPWDGAPGWVGYALALATAFAPMITKGVWAWHRGEAAEHRTRASQLRRRAERAEAVGKSEEANRLTALADDHDAHAAELEARAGKP